MAPRRRLLSSSHTAEVTADSSTPGLFQGSPLHVTSVETTRQRILSHSKPAPASNSLCCSDDEGSSIQQAAAMAPAPSDLPEKGCNVKVHPVVPPRTRYYLDGRSGSYKQPWHLKLLAQLTLALYVCWCYILLGLIIASLFSRTAAVVTALLFATVMLPRGKLLNTHVLDWWIFRVWRDYFNFSVVYDELHDLRQHYVYVIYPHGVFPISQLVAHSLYSQLWLGHRIYCLSASVVFSIPLFRHFLTALGCGPATAHMFKQMLELGSVGCMAGGIAEMYMVERDQEVIKLLDRKGFTRVAVERGVGIIPLYHFGNSQALSMWPKSLQQLGRKLRMAFGLITGAYGLPIPHQVPFMMAVGSPVSTGPPMPKDHPDFSRRVDEVHAQVVAAVREVYDKNKALYGWENRPLMIV